MPKAAKNAESEGAGLLNQKNAHKSLLSDFLAWDIPNIVFALENAIAWL